MCCVITSNAFCELIDCCKAPPTYLSTGPSHQYSPSALLTALRRHRQARRAGDALAQNQRVHAGFKYYAQSDGPRSTLLTYFGGTPWEKPESYSRHSPRSGIANIRTPSLLQIVALDINHNNEIYWSLTDRKIPVEYIIYPREPHGFTEPEHQRDVMERNLRWFTR